MSKKITLESKIEKLLEFLYDGYRMGDLDSGIPDYEVMTQMGCSPQSWSRYRPQIVQYLHYQDLVKIEVIEGKEMEIARITIRYDKKGKKWFGKRNQLKIKDKYWRDMTPVEQKEYDIVWDAEEHYL